MFVTRQFRYTRVDVTESPTGVETEKGSKRVLKILPKFTTVYEVTKDKWLKDLVKHKHQDGKLTTYQ